MVTKLKTYKLWREHPNSTEFSIRIKKKAGRWINAFIFLFPVVLTLMIIKIIKIIPFVGSIIYSFTNWNGVSNTVTFNGLDNLKILFRDDQFWYSLLFTLKFALLTLFLSNLFGFTLASFLSKPLKFRNLMRAGFYVPNVLGGLILGFIWQFIFMKVFPAIGAATGLKVFNLLWLGTPNTALSGMIIVEVWKDTGFLMLLYIAGFTTIPNELLESAMIDGANSFRILKNIIIPLMMATITRCLFLSILTAMRLFELNHGIDKWWPLQVLRIYHNEYLYNSFLK